MPSSSPSGPDPARRAPVPATLEVDSSSCTLRCDGDWSVFGLAPLDRRLDRLRLPRHGRWQLHTDAVDRLDTAGALLLHQLIERLRQTGCQLDYAGVPSAHRSLLELVGRSYEAAPAAGGGARSQLERLGRATAASGEQLLAFLAFVGSFTLVVLPHLLRPWRIRGRQVVVETYKAGVTALPIVGLLAFLLGLVIAYQGGIALEPYGANIFLVDLVAITMLREMAPLITAIVVAGRTGSAYAAQIGTMRITEEVDALRALGLHPYEVLALPKLLALLIALPLLSGFAVILGIAGGMAIANLMFGVDYFFFLERLGGALSTSHFWVGILKTPVFAAIIVLIGCFHGFRVEGSAESVGRATTTSVVQCIFLVIVADAAFSIVFSLVGL